MYAVSSIIQRLAIALIVFATLLSVSFLSRTYAMADEPMVRLPQGAGHAAARGEWTGRLPSQDPVNLAITLPLRNQADLNALLTRLYDPSDPSCGQFLTPQEFTNRFAPTEQQYDAVAAYARACGLQVSTHPNRLVLDISGPASSVEAAFSIHLNTFQKSDGQSFFAADNAPALPVSIASLVTSVQGLDGSVCLHPNVRVLSQQSGVYTTDSRTNSIGHGVSGGLTPSDIKAAYSSTPITQDGTGQNVAIFELDDYTNNEVARYINQYFRGDRRIAPVSRVLVDGGPGGPSGTDGELEVALDIDMNLALAPHAKNIYVYEAPNSAAGIVDEYNRIAVDDKAQVVSTSWGIWEDEFGTGHGMQNLENTIFQEMAAQGQSVYAATGDYGAYDPYSGNVSAQDPASQPWVCGVGGTHLSLNSNGSYNSESCWWNGPTGSTYTSGYGSGGGVSSYWTIPSYQSSYFSSYFDNIGQHLAEPGDCDMASRQNRNIPDVSLDADPSTGYDVYSDANGYGWICVGGTSASVQVWGAFTALLNQSRAGSGVGPVGFPSFALYSLAATKTGATAFHDIVSGPNGNGYWSTGPAYDNTTGLGSFDLPLLMQKMQGQPTGLSAPSTPSNMTAVAGDRSLSATCAASPGATRYQWYLYQVLPGATAALAATTTTPSAKIGNLVDGEGYWVRVVASNSGGSSAPSLLSNMVTPQSVAIAGGPSTVANGWWGITVIWSTNVSANATIQYGRTPSLGMSAQVSRMTTNHSITLVNVTPGATYYYKVVSSDGVTTAASTGSFKP